MNIADRLWVADSGRISCDRHGGNYMTTALEAKPWVRRIFTPLDTWYVMTDADAAYFTSEGLNPACETCGGTR